MTLEVVQGAADHLDENTLSGEVVSPKAAISVACAMRPNKLIRARATLLHSILNAGQLTWTLRPESPTLGVRL
jgi:hypothetical protein